MTHVFDIMLAFVSFAVPAQAHDDGDGEEDAQEHMMRCAAGMVAERAHSANSELAVLAEVLSVLPARSGSVSNSGRLELDAASAQVHAPRAHLPTQPRSIDMMVWGCCLCSTQCYCKHFSACYCSDPTPKA